MNSHVASIALLKKFCSGVAFTALFGLASASAAPINLVKNGDFSISSGTGQIGYNTTVADWSTGGYNFLFGEGTADTTGALTWFGSNPLMLWGANNGGAHALAASANGGNFIGADGDYAVAPISQLIDGLIAGQTYEVSFEWAAAQQYGFSGETTEYWRVNLGSDASTWQATGIYQNANHASSGWMNHTMQFTASSASEWLTFMAVGTPEGEPPFSLLDGVTMTQVPNQLAQVPEPGSVAMFLAGLGLVALVARRRRRA
jgi:hypothetical protein